MCLTASARMEQAAEETQRANARLAESIPGARMGTVEGATHFMVATHAAEVARVVGSHIEGIIAG